jgi:hypothetical protein
MKKLTGSSVGFFVALGFFVGLCVVYSSFMKRYDVRLEFEVRSD